MGFRHDGLSSLLPAARAECDVVVMSLFVNPTQFGPGEDLERYPRDEERDLRLASEAGADFVYAPPVEEGYPEGIATAAAVGGHLTPVPDRGPAPPRPRAFPRRHHRRRQALQQRRPRRRLLRPEGRAAGGRYPADGPRSRFSAANRGSADGSRGRRPGDELPQRLPR